MDMKMEMHSRQSLYWTHGLDLRRSRGFNLRGWFAALVKRSREATRKRRDYRILMEMDDHLLRDIGLTRSDIVDASLRAAILQVNGR
jgi:uncharacterized protein YjiS (DUF1127 family)